jgi:hypothetical protein
VTDRPTAEAPSAQLVELARAYGVATEYWDWLGEHVTVSRSTIRAVLGALGVDAGTEEAVAVALRDYLARLEELRALIDEGLESGDPVDGETFLRELLEETRALAAKPDG